MRQTLLSALLSTLVLSLIAPAVGDAQVPVVTDITSSGLGTEVPLQLPPDGVYNITGGIRPGGGLNLFHSFGDFSIGQGDIANFLNDSGLPTSNIIGRVTGGNSSSIDGTIQTTGFDVGGLSANLFLVNPNGIVFGPHGSLNVGGSVSFSTAQYIRLFDSLNGVSANFYADFAKDSWDNSVFAMAPVVDFGFLSPAAYGFLDAPNPEATIMVQGSDLSIPTGQSISLVGKDVVIESGTPVGGTAQRAQLSAPNGRIQLAVAASPGEFDVNTLQPLPNNPVDPASAASFTSYGSVSLESGSSIDVSGARTVFIQGGQLVLSVNDAVLTTSEISAPSDTISLGPASSIVTSNAGTEPGADVQIAVGNLSLNGSLVKTETLGDGEGGDITANIGTFVLSDGGGIITQTSGPGLGGDVRITADNLTLENGSIILTTTSGLGELGGDLFLNVGSLRLMGGDFGGSLILSRNNTGTDLDGDGVIDVAGTGGNIAVQGIQGAGSVADSVFLSGSSGIASDAQSGSGAGGRISIRATSLELKEASSVTSSTSAFGTDLDGDGILDDPTAGAGGDILVAAQNLRVLDGASIVSSTGFPAPLAVAGGAVTVQGLEGPGSKAGSVLLSGQNTGISSNSAFGLPGDLTVNAETLTITNGAVISAGTSQSTGPAGEVTVTADSVVISAGGQILSQSFSQDAGQVAITANKLTLDGGSIVTSTSSENLGRGGDVVLNGGTVSLTNRASINSQSETLSNGRAGDITMNIESLRMSNLAEITSSSKGTLVDAAGDAGNITIHSGSTVVMNDSSITTEAREASGGQITITAPEMIRLTNSQISTSVAGSEADTSGGDISIDPQFVILQNSQIFAKAFAGSGGNIDLISKVFLADPSSEISASSQLGISGTVNIEAPVQNVSGELVVLSEDFSSVAALLAQQCAARVADGKFSTFVVAVREGLPVEPGGFLASPSFLTELGGSALSKQLPPIPHYTAKALFPEYDAKPIQLAKLGSACRR
jgi:filamentous hemagglutinin family protein